MIAGVCALLEDDYHLAVRQLELLMGDEMMNEAGCSKIWRIIRDDFNLRKAAAQWVP